MENVDVAVVGMGALGSAAAYHLARKGLRVVAFEQFELGHVRGASHDTSRIIRTSYGAPRYVRLAQSAYRDWADFETVAGERAKGGRRDIATEHHRPRDLRADGRVHIGAADIGSLHGLKVLPGTDG